MASNKNKKRTYSYWEWIGFLLVDLSLVLAFTIHYKHYYEIMVLGFALIMYELDRRYLFFPQYIRLYIILLKAGLVGDLILGIGLGLWHYNFVYLYEYLSVYLVVYPVAGIVMVQTYILLIKVMRRRKRVGKPLPLAFYKRCVSALGLCSVITASLALMQLNYEVTIVVFYSSVALFALALLSYISRIHNHDTLLEEIHNNPLKMLLILFLVTYFYAFVHEVSNGVAHEWVYSDFSYTHSHILGIPLAVLPFWPLLVLLPVAAYYYAIPSKLTRPKMKQSSSRSTRRTFIAHMPRHALGKSA